MRHLIFQLSIFGASTRKTLWIIAALVLIVVNRNYVCAQDATNPPVDLQQLERFKNLLRKEAPTPILQPAQRLDEAATKGKMRIRVVDFHGDALPGAKVHLSVWTNEKNFKHNWDYTCDAGGQTDMVLPKTFEIIRVWARQEGYVPMWAQWWPQMQADGDKLPDEFTFRLEKGVLMGGTVQDGNGTPISGVKVEAMLQGDHGVLHGEKATDVIRPDIDIWLAEGEGNDSGTAKITDDKGHWSLGDIPEGQAGNVLLKFTHPDYISDADWGESQVEQHLKTANLLAQNATLVMERGVRVSGKITDADDQPVSGALVIWGDRPYLEHRPQQEVHTDEKGLYRFPPLRPGRMRVTVVAKNWMPQLRFVQIHPQMESVDFQLRPGKALRIKFVDTNGNPVPKVYVSIQGWKEGESLYNYKHPNVLDSKIPREADKSGIYEWTWAPDDPVLFSFSTDRFYLENVTITADDSEHVQTIGP